MIDWKQDVEFFTAADEKFRDFAENLCRRFYELNGIRIRVLNELDFRLAGIPSPHWIKGHLFRFARPQTKYVAWIDADIIPLLPLPPLNDVQFAAMQDGYEQPLHKEIEFYFNSGFFVASRAVEHIFEKLIAMEHADISDNELCFEQTPMNRLIHEAGIPVTRLDAKWNWMTHYGDPSSEAVHYHFAGVPRERLRKEWIKRGGIRPRLLMVQPGLHGDAIICAPIAAWYAARGWEVVWPTFDQWTYRALWRHFDYITPVFINKVGETIIEDLYRMADSGEFDKVLYLWVNATGDSRAYRPDLTETNFVSSKYRVADVPLDEKWNFSYRRDPEAEADVYRKVVESRGLKPGGYALVHDATWCGSQELGKSGLPIVKLEEFFGFSLLDWRLVCERAGEMNLIESALSNFVEVLPACRNIPKRLTRKADWVSTPQYRNGWTFTGTVMRQRMDVHFLVDDEVLSVSSELIEPAPPEQRGCARVLVHRRKDGSFAESKVRDLPALLEKYETWINVSRARSRVLPITLASAHQLTMRLVRDAGAESIYCIEGPRVLIEGAQAWTQDGKRIEIKAQYKGFQSLYRAEIDGGNYSSFHENGVPARDGEGLMARVYGSVYDDASAVHLDAPTLAALNVRRLAYHQDFSGYESIPADELDAFEPHPEEYALLDPFTRTFRCAVGLPALKALETAARGELDGECGLFIRPPYDFRGADAWLVPIPLPSETTFYALSAFVGGHEAACGIVRKAVEGKFRFHRYGDLLLVI